MGDISAATMSKMEGFKPAPALLPYVTDIWTYEIPRLALADTPGTLTLLPDGFPTMCFVYGDPLQAAYATEGFTTRSAVCGFHSQPVRVSCGGEVGGLTVRFTPWGLSCFVPFSLAEAAERRIPLRDFFPRCAIEDLESELFELRTSLARVRRVEAFLLAQLRPHAMDPTVHHAMSAMAADGGVRGIRQIARDMDLSERTLERKFQRTIGVPPKTFARVARLQEALRRRDVLASWVESALDCGYYDQAHLIRDAKAIFGLPPEALIAASGNIMADGFQSLARDMQLDTRIFR